MAPSKTAAARHKPRKRARTRPDTITLMPSVESLTYAHLLGLEPLVIDAPVHNTVILRGGERIWNSHHAVHCRGNCCIHRVSDHHMRSWSQHWRADRRIMERICPAHGIGHPDPDDVSPDRVHGCCGCC